MIHRARALFGLCGLALLPGNAVSQAATDAETLAIFQAACLERLPTFDGAGAGFADAGLTRNSEGFWTDDSRGLIGRTTASDDDRQRFCLLAMQGADVPGIDAVLGTALGNAMDEAEVGVIRGPTPGDPSLYLVERGGYRVTAVVANVSRGYVMLSVGVDVAEGATPPWSGP